MNKTSLEKLKTCHEKLISLVSAVNETFQIQVICGIRNEKEQNEAVKNGYSKLAYPNSKHNKKPSLAVDVVPDPDRNPATLEWGDIKSFELMCLSFEQKADELGIKIRLGRDFKFKDFPHIELVT